MYKDSPTGMYSPLNAAQGGGIVVKRYEHYHELVYVGNDT